MELHSLLKQRFEEKIDKKEDDECWIWKGAKNNNGYGSFYFNGKMYGAHQISWIIYHGNILEKLYVLHKCDNPLCVNPKHLFLGTQKDNIKDMINKSRNCDSKGENNNHSKLTQETVNQIRKKYKNGEKQINIAKEFNIRFNHVNDIVHNRIWKE